MTDLHVPDGHGYADHPLTRAGVSRGGSRPRVWIESEGYPDDPDAAHLSFPAEDRDGGTLAVVEPAVGVVRPDEASPEADTPGARESAAVYDALAAIEGVTVPNYNP